MAKTEILKFRVTPEEKEIIVRKALSSYKLVSCYLRDCALEKPITVINGADSIAEELRRIDNNVNQITRCGKRRLCYRDGSHRNKRGVETIWQSLNLLLRAAR